LLFILEVKFHFSLSLSSPRQDGLTEHPDGLLYNSFLRSNRILEYFEYAGQSPDVLSRRPDGLQRLPN
jgi:hypothetical protein